MGKGENGRANASLVISMLALLMAVTGVATAAKNSGTTKLPVNSVGSAQLKPGAVQTSDLGKNAVVTSKVAANTITARILANNAVDAAALQDDAVTAAALQDDAVRAAALAKGAVTSQALASNSVVASSLAPAAVTSTALADNSVLSSALASGAVTNGKIKDGAVGSEELKDGAVGTDQIAANSIVSQQLKPNVITAQQLAPKAVTTDKIDAVPGGEAVAANVGMNDSFMSCFLRDDIPFSIVTRNVSGVFDLAKPSRLTAPVDGIYRVTAALKWAAGAGTVRDLHVSRTIGSGPNEGQHYTVQSASSAPAAEGETNQTLTFDVALNQGDYVQLNAFTCGANVVATSATMAMNWAGSAS